MCVCSVCVYVYMCVVCVWHVTTKGEKNPDLGFYPIDLGICSIKRIKVH